MLIASLPTFLNPWYAAAAAAATIPPLILLYFLKLRRREMPVSSTILWKKAIVDLQVNAPFQKLRRNLLLILQLLLLILLLLALSRPIISYAKGAGRSTVILIDRSASMAAKDGLEGKGTRLEEAKARAKSLVDTLDRSGQAMVIAFDDSAETVQAFTADTVSLKNAIDSIKQTDRKSRLKLAYQLAEAQTNFNPDQLRSIGPRPDVRVYSDGRVLDATDLSIHADVTYEKIGSDKSANIGIIALSARLNYERQTEVQVFARLENLGPDHPTADVQLPVDGAIQPHIGTVSLLPERWDDQQRKEAEAKGQLPRDGVEFTLDLSTSAVVRIEQMNKTGDVLAADDFAQVVVPPPKDLNVLLVTTGADPFMQHAFDSLGLQKVTTMSPSDYEQKKPAVGDFDVIVFDAVKPGYVPDSGNFVDVGVVPDHLKIHAAMKNGKVEVNPDIVGILDWSCDPHDFPRRQHAQRRQQQRHEAGSRPRRRNPRRLHLRPPRRAPPRRTPDAPHHRVRHARQHLANTLRRQRLPPLLVQLDEVPGARFGHRHSSKQRTRRDAAHSADDSRALGPRYEEHQADRSDRPHERNPDSGGRRFRCCRRLDHVGVYTTDPALGPFEHIAVNLLDPVESNVLPADKAPGGIGETTASGPIKARLELWWWLTACAALPLLMIEWWVYTRRVHM